MKTDPKHEKRRVQFNKLCEREVSMPLELNEKLNEKTLKSFVKFDEHDNRYYCKLCPNKTYISEQRCINHIKNCHSEHERFKNTYQKFENEQNKCDITHCQNHLVNIFKNNEQNWQAMKNKFIEKLKKSDIDYVLSWQAEDMVKNEQSYNMVKKIEVIFNKLGFNKSIITWDKGKLIEFQGALNDYINDYTKSLLQNPYQHNSTSLMSNAVDEWKKYAIAETINDDQFSPVNQINYIKSLTKRIIKLMKS